VGPGVGRGLHVLGDLDDAADGVDVVDVKGVVLGSIL
jgi:hypothetical protein